MRDDINTVKHLKETPLKNSWSMIIKIVRDVNVVEF